MKPVDLKRPRFPLGLRWPFSLPAEDSIQIARVVARLDVLRKMY